MVGPDYHLLPHTNVVFFGEAERARILSLSCQFAK